MCCWRWPTPTNRISTERFKRSVRYRPRPSRWHALATGLYRNPRRQSPVKSFICRHRKPSMNSSKVPGWRSADFPPISRPWRRNGLSLLVASWKAPGHASSLVDNYLEPLGISSMLDASVWVRGEIVGVLCHEHAPDSTLVDGRNRLSSTALGAMVSLALEESNRGLLGTPVARLRRKVPRLARRRKPTRRLCTTKTELSRQTTAG